jgi:xylulokinase
MNVTPTLIPADLLLGIDFGTGGCKISFLTPEGEVVASAAEEYPTLHPYAGWAEQDAGVWHPALVKSLQRAWAAGKVAPTRVAALAISASTHNAVLLDASMRPLRPVIMWTDQRSAAEAGELEREHGEAIFRIGWQRPTPTWTLPQLLWLKRNEPAVFARVAHVLFVKDYVRWLLTGETGTDYVDAQGTLLFDMGRNEWSPELCALAGLPTGVFPRILRPAQLAGRITHQAARETGLLAGTPVVCGSSDTAAEAFSAGVVDPGQCIVKLATAGNVNVFTTEPKPHRQTLTYAHVVPGLWYSVTATNAAATCQRWFRDRFCAGEIEQARGEGGSAFTLMSAAAAESPPGAGGLFFHPYLQGERSPYWDPHLRASFTGITTRHERGDFIRAVMEGVAFSLRDCRRVLEALELPTDEIRLIGGGARDPLWAQIVCDVMGTTVTLPAYSDASAGAAMLAGVGVGIFSDEREAARRCGQAAVKLQPRAAEAETYAALFQKYRKIHDVLAEVYHDASDQPVPR